MSQTADVVVIGGGVNGVSIAYALAARGVKTVLVEKGALASGASGRSSGLVRMHYTNEWDARLAWASFPVFRNWTELMGGPTVFTHTGFVNVVAPTDPSFTPPAGACRGSLRVTWSGSSGAERYAVWWSSRPDSSAALLGARSLDGGATWSAPLPVDTLDRSGVGCNRPPPAIAADSQTGYVHVAYAMHAPEGTGVFFAHAMDRGTMYHAPVAIVYGDRLVDVDVAALHDTVAVAYTDPSMRYPHVGLALSRTLGHIFEVRIPTVARTGSGNAGASSPAVALAPGRIAIAWIEREIAGPPTLVTVAGRLHLAGAR